MKVSIIMCAYNVAEFIERAIDSVLAQTYQNWELIISNDSSTDDTAAIIERYLGDPRIILINQPKNIGYVRNKNYAFQQATGRLLTQLDADDTSPADRLQKQVNVFLQQPEIMICGTNYQQIDLADEPVHPKHYDRDRVITELEYHYPFWFPGLMFRSNLIEEFGLFSEYFSGIYGDDHYWTIRVNRKYPIYFIKDILYNYRINPNSLTNVYDNPRKLIIGEIITELLEQQKKDGKDWLEEGAVDKMQSFEKNLLENATLMAEKYRLWAAKAIDKKDLKQARALLKKSIRLKQRNKEVYRTMLYYLRSKYSK